MTPRALEVHLKILASAGLAFQGRRKGLSFTANIFGQNLDELMRSSAFVEDSESGMSLFVPHKNGLATSAHRDVVRHFHNFIAAAQTLVEHTRNFMRRHYAKTTLHEAYLHKVSTEFVTDELSRFIQDMRNYYFTAACRIRQLALTLNSGAAP